MSQETAELYASHMMALASQARAAIRDLDPKVESTHTYMYMYMEMDMDMNMYMCMYMYMYLYIYVCMSVCANT